MSEGRKTFHGGDAPGATFPPEPAGLELLQPVRDGSPILKPEMMRKSEEANERKLQFERRRLALEMLSSGGGSFGGDREIDVKWALGYADELIKQTGGVL